MNKKFLLLGFLIVFLTLSFSNHAKAGNDVCTVELPCETENHDVSSISRASAEHDKICIYYFYGQNCPHCARTEPLINQLAEKYNQIDIKSFEVYFDNENQNLFNDFNVRYGIKQVGIPTIFIGDMALVGEKAIKEHLEENINYFLENPTICPTEYNKVESTQHEISPSKKTELTAPVIVTAALVDSINPCAFAVLIFLLVYLTSLGAKRRILKVGLTFIFTVFVVYFLSGLGLFKVIQTTGMTRTVYTLAAVIAIIAGLINVKDFFWYGKGLTLAIPKAGKPLIKKYIQKSTIPAAIILGILVSLFELPCTGGVYLAILGLLSSKMTMREGIPYLLLYNLIFILPLIVLLLIVYRGISPEKIEKWRVEKRKWMKLVMSLVMIALGAIMLLGWV